MKEVRAYIRIPRNPKGSTYLGARSGSVCPSANHFSRLDTDDMKWAMHPSSGQFKRWPASSFSWWQLGHAVYLQPNHLPAFV